MKLNNIFNNINFQKTLVANCQIGTPDNRQNAKIYLLDEKDDYRLLKDAQGKEMWVGEYYLGDICNNFFRDIDSANHYVMENKNGQIICVSKAIKKGKKINLEYIETAPKMSCYNHTRKLKYIGETMLAFLVKSAKQAKKTFEIQRVAQRKQTLDFYYKQCGFEPEGDHSAIMPREKSDTFLKKNEKHTGSTIELVA